MFEFEKCSKHQQVSMLLNLAEKLCLYFRKDEYRILANHIIKICREWERDKSILPDDLYDYIDGGGDEDISIIQEESEGDDTKIWECYIYIVSYICKLAYEYNNEVYVPQIIEIIDEYCYTKIKEICQNIAIWDNGIFTNLEKNIAE